jgi:hypothetical protein
MFDPETKSGEETLSYLIYPGDPIRLPIFHCKRCHHTSCPRLDEAPKRCTNRNGYTDDKGIVHPRCASQKWYLWPEDFDTENIECGHCRILWEMEQQGIKPPAPKPRGRPFKSQKS